MCVLLSVLYISVFFVVFMLLGGCDCLLSFACLVACLFAWLLACSLCCFVVPPVIAMFVLVFCLGFVWFCLILF